MKKIAILFILVVSIFRLTTGQDISEGQVLKAIHSISSHDLLDYVKLQTDDKYAGRLAGTPEYKECAELLAGYFNDIGLKPADDNGGWFQSFDIPYTLIFPYCGVTLHIPVSKGEEIQKHYQYVSEFMPGSTSGDGSLTAEVVYAGYGITAPELGYENYKGIDVKGKIILIEREAPVSPNEVKSEFDIKD